MSYWHQQEDGSWYFDWMHLVPILPIVIYGIICLAKYLLGY